MWFFDRWSTRMSIRVHRKAFLAIKNSWRILEDFHCQERYPVPWHKLWPLHASALYHWLFGLFDVVKLSNSAEFKSFLLIMCIDASESTTNSLSSGLRVDGAGKHQFSEREKNAVLFSPLILGYFWPTSTLLHGTIALTIPSLPETDPQILEFCGYTLMRITWQIIPSDGFFLEC